MESCKIRYLNVVTEACGGKNRNIMMRVIIIGGGASGLMAAITAARGGAKVTVLEHQNQVGKKILVTGNGRCNFTNTNQDLSHYHSESLLNMAIALKQFNCQDTVKFFKDLGIFSKNRNGYLYPHSDAASAVLEVLRMECEHLKVKIACQIEVESIEKCDGIFKVHTPGWTYEAEKLILATGSKAAPATGSDGSGYTLAKNFGHTVIEPYPALVQLLSKEKCLNALAGLRIDARAILFTDEKPVISNRGEVQLNANNISGIPVFQISAEAAKAMANGAKCHVVLDLLPDFSEELLISYMKQRISTGGYKSAVNFLTGLFAKKLSEVLCDRCKFSKKLTAEKFTEDDITNLCKQIKNFKIQIYGTNGFEHAQCCGGGVSLEEVDPLTMESLKVPGLYFCGELLDVHGDCGGYNLQWAWTSGYLAGKAIND